MKKILASVLALTMLASVSTTAYAAQVNQNTEDKTVDSVITTSIEPTYTITIPEDVSVAFNAQSTEFGAVTLDDAQIDPGYAVQVDLTASGTLKNAADETKTIAYTVNSVDGVFTSAQYDAAGEATSLTIDITQDAWNTAYAGDYSDTVTFTVSYVEVL